MNRHSWLRACPLFLLLKVIQPILPQVINIVRKALLILGIIVGLSAIWVTVFLSRDREMYRGTTQGQTMENILYIESVARTFVTEHHITLLDGTFKTNFLSDKNTVEALSSMSLSVIDGKVIDDKRTTYDFECLPPAFLLVTASDGQNFKADFSQ
jgi:hypothetical protein